MVSSELAELIKRLDEAEHLASQFIGGWCSSQFFSAEEFHIALADSISRLKSGDRSQLDNLYFWFMPTSSWDTFVGIDGQDLANQISALLSKIKD
jgi:hypothetical protein